MAAGLAEAAAAFADTFWVAWVLVVLTLVPAFFLPRKHEESAMVDEQAEGAPAGGHALTPSRRICAASDVESAHRLVRRLDAPVEMRRLDGLPT